MYIALLTLYTYICIYIYDIIKVQMGRLETFYRHMYIGNNLTNTVVNKNHTTILLSFIPINYSH